jgi:hypothetical protein
MHSYTNVAGQAATKAAGSQVGQEFIDYYNVDLSLVDVDYYSFGTGMTIYHSTDNSNWTVVGDSQGRCGYQNQDLFGGEYRTVLAKPLAHAAQGASVNGNDTRAGAAGKLLWAPHVMYNLTQDKWMYYGSTSAWNSNYSTVFVLTSDNVASGYVYDNTDENGIIVKTQSGDSTNAIDSCVYYGHDANGKIDPTKLYCLYGSWGNIMVKELNTDGFRKDGVRDFGSLLSISVGGGEGGYMVYNNGYYYYYISPGANGGAQYGGAYHIRAYRSQSPDRDFVSIANTHANANEPPHGNSILTGYENTAANDYVYTSIGHSSVYTAYNADNDPVFVNAAHTREYTRGAKPIEDGQFSTRQIWLIGNVAIHNPIVYTENGWPVAFPMQYDNTFSTKFKGENWRSWAQTDPSFAAYDIEGTYASNEMLIEPNPGGMKAEGLDASVNYEVENVGKMSGFSTEKSYTIIASGDKEGVFLDNSTNTGHKFKITTPADNSVTYITLYESDGTTPYAYGAFANQGTWGNATPEFSFVTVKGASDSLGGRHIMGVRTALYPRDAVNASGDMVELDDVIYTHASDSEVLAANELNENSEESLKKAALSSGYAVYGHEISDNLNYGNTVSEDSYSYNSTGERLTTIKVTYPYYIDTNNQFGVVDLDDAEFVAHGYSSSNIKAVPVKTNFDNNTYTYSLTNGEVRWFKDDANGKSVTDNSWTDSFVNNQEDKEKYYHYYVITGTLSDYFHYFDNEYDFRSKKKITGYPETGAKLLIQYNKVGDSHTYGEYEFPYVMPNPAPAHTIVGSHNQFDYNYDSRMGQILFDRFVGSYGSGTNIKSKLTINNNASQPDNVSSTEQWKRFETGTFNYVDLWGNSDSMNAAYESPELMSNRFSFFGSKVGVNSGAYGILEHKDNSPGTFTVGTNVVDADYYIDYSDKDNYIENNSNTGLITTNNGVPTGYSFDMRTANIKWANGNGPERRWGTTSYVLATGDVKNKLTMDSTFDGHKDKFKTGTRSNEHRYTYGNYYYSGDNNNNAKPTVYPGAIFKIGTDSYDERKGVLSDVYYDANNPHADLQNWGEFRISGIGKRSSNESRVESSQIGSHENKYSLGYIQQSGVAGVGRMVMSGYYSEPAAYKSYVQDVHTNILHDGVTVTDDNLTAQSDYFTYGLMRALPLVDAADKDNNDTNQWNMHITFTGTESVEKNSDPGENDSARAEKYANFILEQGIMSFPFHSTGYRNVGVEEAYAYYNIGVHTTDKGAVREFVDTFANKEFTIDTVSATRKPVTDYSDTDLRGTSTEKGVITKINEGAAIDAANYTVSSYNAYLDALAEAYWFVNNPKNTTYTKGDNTYEYSVAYNSFGGEDHAAIYASDQGDNIFGQTTPASNTYTGWNDSRSHTDEKQAEIIADVIVAYKNLFDIDDYKAAEDVYANMSFYKDTAATKSANIRTDAVSSVESIKIGETKYADNDYTSDSWTNFVQLAKDVCEDFDYYTVDEEGAPGYDYKSDDINSWRYVPLNGSDYKELLEILKSAQKSLMPALDTASLNTLITTKKAARDGGVFTGTNGAQEYTVASWNKLNGRISTAEGLKTPAPDKDAKYRENAYFTVGRYDVTGVTKYEFGDVTYYAQNFDNTEFDKTGYKSADNCSPAQEAIYDELNLATGSTETGTGTNTEVLGGINLTPIDDAACYTTYDNANTVVSAVDMDKYTDHESENREEWGGKQIIEDALSTTKNAVYASDDDLTAYNTKFSTNLTAANKVKKTTTGETDPQTAALLSAINTVNNTHVDKNDENSDYKYIKYFDASLTVQQTNREGASYSTSNKVKYGDSVDFTIPNGMDSKPVVNWGVTTLKGVYGSVGDSINSQKLSGFQGTSITRVVTSNIAVVAEVDPESVAEDKIQYNILDCYGHLAEVKYVSNKTEITVDSNNIATAEEVKTKIGVEPKQIPFYTCTSWQKTKNSETLITLKPLYSTKKPFNYTFIGATTEGQNGVLYDTKVQVAFDTTNGDFAAWAVKVGSGSESDPYKYQIASYSQSYSFYACADETYVAIVNRGTDAAPVYETVEETPIPITASNLDGAITETGKIGSDAFVTQKIHDNMAFVSVENVQMEGTKVRLYVRITEGATEPTGYGVLVRKDYTGTDANMVIGAQGVTRKVVTSKLSTGQFTYTINKSAGFTTGDAVSFRAFVNYDFSYTDVNTTVSINALDYSRTLKVQKS